MTINRIDYSNGRTREISDKALLVLPVSVDEEAVVVVSIVPAAEPSISGDDEMRLARLQKLADLSSDPDSLDWQALARINAEAWGADTDSE